MYILDALAIVFIILHLAYYQFAVDWASFYSVVPSSASVAIIFGLIFTSFICAFLDNNQTMKKAAEQVNKGISKS